MTASSLLVLDASVAVKWFADEVYTPEAVVLTSAMYEFIAPELIQAEVASALLKKVRRHEFPREMIARSLDLLGVPVVMVSTAGMESRAFELADRHGCSLYDGLYMLFDLDSGCRSVTADRKL